MSEMNGLLVAGDVYIDRLTDTGQSTGLIGPINTTQLQINTPTNEVNRTSKKKASFGNLLDSVKIAQPPELTIVFDDQPAELLAMAMLGDVQILNVPSSTITDEAVTLPANQRWVSLSVSNLASAGLSVKLASDNSVVPVADYEVNYALGLIRAVKGGSVEEGAAVKVSAQANAISGQRITGVTSTQLRARVKVDGKNLATGLPVKVTIPEAVLAPTQAVDLMAAEFVSCTLSGKIKTLTTETAPFYIDQTES